MFVAVVIYFLSNVSSSVTSYIMSLFRKRFDQALLSDFLGNLLHLIIVPQLQWNLICLKWVEILEHNIWRKRLKQRLFNIHSGELWRKKKTVFEESLMNSVPCHYNCRQKQIINYFKSFHTSKNIYRRPQNFCKNAQELLTTFYLTGVKLLKRKKTRSYLVFSSSLF